ncbi:hypothetical protein TNCV_2449361 [Trichonephila clavipes]|nr:hypothetical protein TNCV_2449361 [Trichonephila clavipes]
MKFVRDRVFDRLISLEKDKVSSKISQLRKIHKVGQSLTSIQNNEDEWSVSSTRDANASVNAAESCRLLKQNVAGNPSLLSSKSNNVAKSNRDAFIPSVKSSI